MARKDSAEDKAYKHQWYMENRERIQEKARLNKLANPEKKRSSDRRSYLKHREKRLAGQKVYNAAHKEEKAAQGRAYRGVNKEAINLKRRAEYAANKEIKRTQARASYLRHREKRLAEMKEWAKANPEAVKKAQKRYKITHREQVLEEGRAYWAKRYAEDPEGVRTQQSAYRAANRERINASIRKLRASRPHVYRSIIARYRARKRNLPDTFTPTDRAFMLQYWQHACALCGNEEGFWHTLADDHWIPLSSPNCPGTIATNMLPLCHGRSGCNNSKNGDEPEKWLLSRFGPQQTRRILKAIEAYFSLVRTKQSP